MIALTKSSASRFLALIAKLSGTTRSGVLTIAVDLGTVKVTSAPPNGVNGDNVTWDVKMTKGGAPITNYGVVEIKLSYTNPLLSVPSSCDCGRGDSQADVDLLEEEDLMKTGAHIFYDVYHDGKLLTWDSGTPSPYLVIDHIGDPPGRPDDTSRMNPHCPRRCKGAHNSGRRRRNAQ